MPKKYTPGIYIIKGTRGIRIGQSKCLERRIPEAVREHKRCIGNAVEIRYIPTASKRKRLKLEKELIRKIRPYCNIIHRR